MKRIAMLLPLILLLLSVPMAALASELPDDPKFDQPVVFTTGSDGEELSVMVAALARSVGLTPIVDDVPSVRITYDVGDPKPFRQVWSLVMTLNELDYVLQDNDVIVVGPPEALATLRSRSGLEPADAAERPDLEQRVYRLSHAQAPDLATVLRDSDVLTTTADGATATAEFTVVADARTNSLIVTGTRGVQERLAELIPLLDAPQPQVNVNIRIQEVNRSVINDFGVDLSAATGSFATTLLSGGLAFVFDAQRSISQLNLAAVLDTLERQNLSRRLDDANLTVLNNETATLNSGGTLTLLVQAETADGDTEERIIEYGVTVDVTPRISSDGRITLTVSAGVSDLIEYSDSAVNLADQRVQSIVTVEPGQTVLLGGLVENVFRTNRQSLPVLGRLPVVGPLFGTTTTEQNDSELLLIVQADVLNAP